MRHSYLLILMGLALFPLYFVGCSAAPNYWTEARPNQKKILVSFPPLYSITHAVAGDDGYVLCMLTTQGPHGHDVAATDLLKINKADLFISNGLELDNTFVDRMLESHKNRSIVTLNVGEVMAEKYPTLLRKGGKEHVHADGVVHKLGKYDPHIWLGPEQAIAITKIIADRLAEIDPSKEKAYQARAGQFIDRLKELHKEGRAAFKGKNAKMVTMHQAFDYFGEAFGITIVAPIQKTPGLDPDANSLANLIDLCKKEKVSVIAVEPQYRDVQAAKALEASLKKEGLNVAVVTLDPLETADVGRDKKFNPEPDYYLKKMRENIKMLAEAMR